MRKLLFVSLLTSVSLLAHHSVRAAHDVDHPATVKGIVVSIEWINPHAHFVVDETDENAKVTRWKLETASPNLLLRKGWTRNTVREGDRVTVIVFPAKDRSNWGSAQKFVLADGREL